MFPFFQSLGTSPDYHDFSNIMESGLATTSASSLMTLGCITRSHGLLYILGSCFLLTSLDFTEKKHTGTNERNHSAKQEKKKLQSGHFDLHCHLQMCISRDCGSYDLVFSNILLISPANGA